MFSNYKMVFTGHYHKRQRIENIQYIGAPYQLNFGDVDDNNKGFEILNLEDGSTEFIKYTGAPRFKKYSYDELWSLVNNTKEGDDFLQNTLVKIVVDKKVDSLSKLKSVLYNNFGVIDIVNEFENKEENRSTDDIKVEMNISVADMIKEFVLNVNTSLDGFEIKGSELVEKFEEIKGELA